MNAPLPTHIGNRRGRRITLVACLSLAVAMVGAAFAAVPLYDMFCRATGYDGTPIVRATEAGRVLGRRITVRFDTNVAPGLRWTFVPEANWIEARIGETRTVFFRVKNEGPATTRAVATYNVQPGQIGAYFVKMQCFCFNEQSLAPGETMDFPVVFYVDPAIEAEKTLEGLSSMTLSYTYFASRNGQPVASAATAPKL